MNPSCFGSISGLEFLVLLTSVTSNFGLGFSINVVQVFFRTAVVFLVFFNAGSNHGGWKTDLHSVGVALFWLFVNGNRDSSDDWHFLHVRLNNRVVSINIYLIEVGFLNVVDVVLLEVFLDNWLSDGFFSRNGNGLQFFDLVDFGISSDGFKLNFLVLSLFNFDFNFFSVDNRLKVGFFD